MTLAEKLRQLFIAKPDATDADVEAVALAHQASDLLPVVDERPPVIVPPAPESTPAELLDAADGPSPRQRIADAMRTGNHALVAKVRAELGL